MEVGEFVTVLTRLVLGALGTFLAILVWSRTRDAAWVLIVVGTLVSYAGIVYAALQLFGIVAGELLGVWGIPVVRVALENLPMAFFIAAFLVVIARARSGGRSRVKPGARSGARKKANQGAGPVTDSSEEPSGPEEATTAGEPEASEET